MGRKMERKLPDGVEDSKSTRRERKTLLTDTRRLPTPLTDAGLCVQAKSVPSPCERMKEPAMASENL